MSDVLEKVRKIVVFDWKVTSFSGWGVYGLNLMLDWALRSDVQALCAMLIDPGDIILNPAEFSILEPSLTASRTIYERRQSWGSKTVKLPTVVLNCLGNQLMHANDSTALLGDPTVGVVFFESTLFDNAARERARQYALIIAGSTWNRDILKANGVDHVISLMQGVNPAYFHPGPRPNLFADKFVVFSGGKLEYRKGQDLVVQAFRIFAQHHPDVLLLTAWSSPWPQLAASLAANPSLAPIRFRGKQPIIWGWTNANGIPPENVFHLGPIPHVQLSAILRAADVALFPNRAEGGTNLVAMECMACGIPAILSANTGHLDLTQEGNCYVLRQQKKIEQAGCDGWGESDVEEILTSLETAYAHRDDAALRGKRGAEFISRFTWSGQLGKLAELLHPYFA
jgi:glycosyltransferase involved in cell wall biosynthesis